MPTDRRVRIRFEIDFNLSPVARAFLALGVWPRVQRQLTQHAYPGQPARKAEHVVQPCTCRYRTTTLRYRGISVVVTSPAFPPYLVLKHMLDTDTLDGSWFEINPACPHHGHIAHTHLIERMWESPYQYGLLRDPYDLDDDERR